MDIEDQALLETLLAWSREHDEDGEKFSRAPFEDMLARDFPRLTDKQRAWAKGLLERYAGGPSTYENLWSSGKVPRGKDVPTPEVLRNLPLKPPGR